MADERKVAVVTGSALNIGRATALALARDGYRVMVTARSSADDCARTAAMIAEAGGEAAVHLADISDAKQARGLIEAAVSRFGRLDVLVNNASVRRQTKFSELTAEEWREILGTTLDGAFYCVHAAAPHILAAGGGSIVNLGGMAAHLGAKGRVHAITAKAGMVGHDARAGEGTGAHRHGELRRARHDRHGSWLRGRRQCGTGEPAGQSDRARRQAGGNRRDGALSLLPVGAVHHRTDDPRERRRVHALTLIRAGKSPNGLLRSSQTASPGSASNRTAIPSSPGFAAG